MREIREGLASESPDERIEAGGEGEKKIRREQEDERRRENRTEPASIFPHSSALRIFTSRCFFCSIMASSRLPYTWTSLRLDLFFWGSKEKERGS